MSRHQQSTATMAPANGTHAGVTERRDASKSRVAPSPSPNGSNGISEQEKPKHAPSPNGTSGELKNPFERPGNPFARRVAELRQAALDSIAPDDVRAIFRKMIELARAGDARAAKLVLAYGIGTPVPAPNPDQLDVEEWKHFKATAPMLGESEGLLMPDPAVILPGIRAGVVARSREYADLLDNVLAAPHKNTSAAVRQWQKKKRRRQRAAEQAAKMHANGK